MANNRIPPGPKGHWLFGSLKEYKNNILEFFLDSVEEYGDLVNLSRERWSGRRTAPTAVMGGMAGGFGGFNQGSSYMPSRAPRPMRAATSRSQAPFGFRPKSIGFSNTHLLFCGTFFEKSGFAAIKPHKSRNQETRSGSLFQIENHWCP